MKEDSRRADIILTIGSLLIVISPLVFYGLKGLLNLGCKQNPLGGCAFEVDLPNTYMSLFLAIGVGVVGIVVFCVGIYLKINAKVAKK